MNLGHGIISTAVLAVIAIVGTLLLGGCASSSTALYGAIGATDAAVRSTTVLLTSTPPTITKAQGNQVLTAVQAVRLDLGTWYSWLQTPSATAQNLANAETAVNADIAALLQLGTSLGNSNDTLRRRLTARKAAKEGQSISDVLALVELAEQLANVVWPDIEAILNANSVTLPQIGTALAGLDSDIATLAAASAAPATPTLRRR